MSESILYGVFRNGEHYVHNVPYFTKKEIPKHSMKIVGLTNLQHCPDSKVSVSKVLACGSSFYYVQQGKLGFTKGYIAIGENEYIALKTKKPYCYILLCVFLLCIGSFVAYRFLEMNDQLGMKIQEAQDIELKPAVKNEQGIDTSSIKFFDNPKISVDKQTYAFQTGDNNQVLLQAEVSKDGAILATSDLVKPNDYISFNMYELLDNGTHDLLVTFYQYNIDDMSKTNFALTQDVTVYVTK